MLLPRKIGKRRCKKKKKETTKMHASSKIGRVQMWDAPSCVSKGVFQNHDEKPYLYLFRL
jgi:hypothetical protein